MRTGTALSVGLVSGVILTIAYNIGSQVTTGSNQLANLTPDAQSSSVTASAQPSTTPSASTSNTASVSKTGDPVNYRYGQIQLKVTKDNGKITSVVGVVEQASGGRQQAFTTLEQAAVAAQGSSFGNLSGATFTTDAFKQALDNALSKF
jgi:uncharacterized protein with FMN-binding domain